MTIGRKPLAPSTGAAHSRAGELKILVTAGPTRETIDPVRYISNRSSGKMGYAVAAAAVHRGHETALITGPVGLDPPAGVAVTRVVTARDMLSAVQEALPWCDALIMAAAVADWRLARANPHKLKKGAKPPRLELEATDDILQSIVAIKGPRLIVGFAAETQDIIGEARRKLQAKDLDLIVANDVSSSDSGFDVDTNRAAILDRNGSITELPLLSKDDLASLILERVEALRTTGLACDRDG